MKNKATPFSQRLLQLIDLFLISLSPLAILGFVIFLIIILSGLIEHVSLIQQYETQGRETTAKILYAPDPDSEYLLVKYNGTGGQVEDGYVRTRYYQPETIAQYREGQLLSVYILPEQVEHEVIPVADFNEFRAYRGYWQGMWLPLLVSYLIVIVHPELLYLGLTDQRGKR